MLALWSRDELAEDAGLFDGGGWGGIALAQNVRSREEADVAVARAVAAGGDLLKAAAAPSGAATPGYIADPDGHPWEIAHNPLWPHRGGRPSDPDAAAGGLAGAGGEGGI